MSFLGLGGGNQNNTTNLTQNIINSMYQQSTEQCQATCSDIAQGNTIIVDNVNVGADFIGINQVCQAQAGCVMETNLQSSSQNIIDSLIKQTNGVETGPFNMVTSLGNDFFGGGNQSNVSNITTTISNMMQQNLSSFCNSYSNEIADGNVIVLGGSGNDKVGFVGVNQTNTANASCTMKNYAKMQAYNQNSATIEQTNKNIDVTGIIAIIIGAIIVVIVVIFAILLLTGTLKLGAQAPSSTGSTVVVSGGQPPPYYPSVYEAPQISRSATVETAAIEGAEAATL